MLQPMCKADSSFAFISLSPMIKKEWMIIKHLGNFLPSMILLFIFNFLIHLELIFQYDG